MSEPNQTCLICGGRGWTGTHNNRTKCPHCRNGWIRVEPKPDTREASVYVRPGDVVITATKSAMRE